MKNRPRPRDAAGVRR